MCKVQFYHTILHLFCAGDEVIEWNGRSLQGKSFQEVYDIIAESKQEPQVELIVSRLLGTRRTPQAQWRHAHSSPTPTHKGKVLEVDYLHLQEDAFRCQKEAAWIAGNCTYQKSFIFK